MGVGLYNKVRPYKILLIAYFWGEQLLIINSLPISLARRRNRAQNKQSRRVIGSYFQASKLYGLSYSYVQNYRKQKSIFQSAFLLQERQNTAEIDKKARVSFVFLWCKLNINEQNTRTKHQQLELPQHLKRARVSTQLLVHVKLPRKDSCIQDYSAIAQRLHAQYCTQYNTSDIKNKK